MSAVIDTSSVTHVLVGFASSLLPELDRLLPPRSVLILEEPEVARVRRAADRCRPVAAIAGLIEAPTQDEEHPEAVLDLVARPRQVRAVVPAVDYGVVCASALATAWGLPGTGARAARALRDKVELRLLADDARIAQPRWQEVNGEEDVEAFRESMGGACVIKPNDRQGSLGVILVDRADDTHRAWESSTIVAEPRLRASRSSPRRYLVEERLQGPEVSVEALAAAGTIIFFNVTAKRVAPGSHPVEIGHVVPGELPDGIVAGLRSSMMALIAATGFGTGVLHGEWILVDGSQPTLVECAARLPGDSIDTLIDLAWGGRLVDDYLGLLEGRAVPGRGPAARAACIRFFVAGPGRVASIVGVDSARASTGVVDVEMAVKPGDEVRALASSTDRVGHVIAVGPDAATAERLAEYAAAQISISIEPAQ
jgi:biotin carboxylase